MLRVKNIYKVSILMNWAFAIMFFSSGLFFVDENNGIETYIFYQLLVTCGCIGFFLFNLLISYIFNIKINLNYSLTIKSGEYPKTNLNITKSDTIATENVYKVTKVILNYGTLDEYFLHRLNWFLLLVSPYFNLVVLDNELSFRMNIQGDVIKPHIGEHFIYGVNQNEEDKYKTFNNVVDCYNWMLVKKNEFDTMQETDEDKQNRIINELMKNNIVEKY